jgi:hypothetical protein
MMEYWSNGIVGNKMEKLFLISLIPHKPNIPTFQYSIIPIGAGPLSSIPSLFTP